MKIELHKIAMEVFFLCIKNGITLEIEWIPRHLNEAADSASREAAMVDTDDWQLTVPFFQLINSRLRISHNKICFIEILSSYS